MKAGKIVRIAVICVLMAWCVAIRFWPLVIFTLSVLALLFLVNRRPDSALARTLYLSFGPSETENEPRSRHLVRSAAYAMGAFIVLAGLVTALGFALQHQFEAGNPWAMGVFFGLVVLTGMAALAMIASLVEVAFLRLSRRDR